MYPYLVQNETLTIGSYGLMLAIAYLAGRWYFLEQLSQSKIPPKNSEVLIVMLLVFGVVGAKIMFLLKHPEESSLAFSGTGFSSQGALIGALIATYIFARFEKLKLHIILDSAAPAAILAYAIARMGCFLSGDDCHGIVTNMPWAMSFPNGIKPTTEMVHPVPLYEIAYSIAIFAFLQFRKTKVTKHYDQLFVLAGLWGICRFLVEFVTTNEKLVLGMSGSQFGALLMFLSATIFFITSRSMPAK